VFRAPTPEPLDEFRRTDTSALPYLARALERFLEDYPSTRDGLSRSERRLLQLAEEGLPLARAFPRMNDGEDSYFISDVGFMDLIEALSSPSSPLVRVSDKSLGLTAAGQDVLAGRKDLVSYGLDRWMGGVHLKTGETPIWRWNEAERRIQSDEHWHS